LIHKELQINENDRYRIERALDIWYGTGVLPSTYTPTFNALDDAYVLFLTRTIDDLYKRIDDRVKIMIQCEWLDEVENLSSDWHQFLLQKKLIGYDDIIRYLDNQINSIEELIALIQQKTRNYAKRQLTFNRMLTKKFEEHRNAVYTEWINLTQNDYTVVAEQVYQKLKGREDV